VRHITQSKKLLYCQSCGAVLGPARYLDFVQKRTDMVARVAGDRQLCEVCARKSTAKFSAADAPLKRG